ncbi:MAG: type II secretion system major pseudopilin GspG [Gammaproteobacteria bacterium]|nr:type II secretion system major pseudopilin GspG [Gammaproteobacteria bacterium]
MSNKNQGFTLLEIMVVVVILGILAAIVVPKIMGRPDQAKILKVKADIENIGSALDLYNLDNGFYPSTAQGLEALVNEPKADPTPTNWHGYLQSIPVDPWGHEYHYACPGQHNTSYDLYSLGADNTEGGNGINRDIGNWNNN